MQETVMKKIDLGHFKFNLYESTSHSEGKPKVLFYHGWGMNVDHYHDVGKEIAKGGYTTIIPELIYHDTRTPLKNPFNYKNMQNYFWKTIFYSIDEFDQFIDTVGIQNDKIILVGSSMGGFIASGIFSKNIYLKGLANINGSGSFLLTEKIFRQKDGRQKVTKDEELVFVKYDPIGRNNGEGPVLLLNGDSDETIPLEGNKDYYYFLTEQERKNNVEFRVYPNINHQFTDEMFKDFLTWLNQFN
ncbi:dienelactone hydrolase family protein [Bacillus sp. 1P02SD]|uniref:dienelactone hydrolase family protein n=1 Tax=Bacillus sp. 1P02SD TaxID=3132264 RepID=UPI0039A07D27